MALSRRDMLKLSGVSAAAVALGGCAAEQPAVATGFNPASGELMPASAGNRVVVCGAGFGGLTTAKYLRKASKDIEVVLIDKKENFMSCPYSNVWLGGVEGVTLDTLSYDYYAPALKNGYTFIQATITGFDRAAKVVKTNMGSIGYDYLVLAPGIEYDYSKLTGGDKAKTRKLQMECPPALMPGSEHLALHKQLRDMEEGNFIISVPEGAYRCPPAPYERAAMVAYFLKTNKIKGKVIILNPGEKPVAKPKEFMEVYTTLYSDIVEFHPFTTVKSVDTAKREITVNVKKGDAVETKVIKYAVANIIPKNVCHPMIKMAGIDTNADGYASIILPSHAAKNDPKVYVVGDAVAATNFAAGSGYPKSGFMANAQGRIVAKQVAAAMGKIKDDGLSLPDNTCFSLVNGAPKEGIVVNHKVDYIVEKDKEGKDVRKIKVSAKTAPRSKDLGKANDEWYRSIMNDMFS